MRFLTGVYAVCLSLLINNRILFSIKPYEEALSRNNECN